MEKWVIAHRGASGLYPENTIPAFKAAAEMGAHCVEMDVQPTRDRKLVIFHDRTLERIARLPHRISDLTWSQLQEVDVGRWKGDEWQGLYIPTLENALASLPSTINLNIELKYHDPKDDWFERAVLDITRRYNHHMRGYLAIKHVESIPRIREIEPEYPIGLLQKKRSPEETFELCIAWDLPVVQIRRSSARTEWVDRYHEHGIKVNFFYSDDIEEMRVLFFDVGVDGILTNYPDRGLMVLRKK